MKKLLLIISHCVFAFLGFVLGIYTLPILTEEKSPSEHALKVQMANPKYVTSFTKQLKGSDFFHWGKGKVTLNSNNISFKGKLAPGPDYRLYLSPKFVETENAFNQSKSKMIQVGAINSFNGFILDIPKSINIDNYSSIIIWCETFGEFITAAEYNPKIKH